MSFIRNQVKLVGKIPLIGIMAIMAGCASPSQQLALNSESQALPGDSSVNSHQPGVPFSGDAVNMMLVGHAPAQTASTDADKESPSCKSCNGTGHAQCTLCKGQNSKQTPCSHCHGEDLTQRVCNTCNGNDWTALTCSTCNGIDWTKQSCHTCDGIDQTKKQCDVCDGSGLRGPQRCYACNGTGSKRRCYSCNGTGHRRRCYSCSGTGSRRRCYSCSGTGKQRRCFSCSGTGNAQTCFACKQGVGQTICISCDGLGEPKTIDDGPIIPLRIAENGSYYGEVSEVTGRPKTIFVEGYFRKDGTYVQSHFRSAPLSSVSPRGPPSFLIPESGNGVAENGSYYGEVSSLTGRPKTVRVRGYYRKDGTYVRGHYRSRPR